jgi:hypothetical protein
MAMINPDDWENILMSCETIDYKKGNNTRDTNKMLKNKMR